MVSEVTKYHPRVPKFEWGTVVDRKVVGVTDGEAVCREFTTYDRKITRLLSMSPCVSSLWRKIVRIHPAVQLPFHWWLTGKTVDELSSGRNGTSLSYRTSRGTLPSHTPPLGALSGRRATTASTSPQFKVLSWVLPFPASSSQRSSNQGLPVLQLDWSAPLRVSSGRAGPPSPTAPVLCHGPVQLLVKEALHIWLWAMPCTPLLDKTCKLSTFYLKWSCGIKSSIFGGN